MRSTSLSTLFPYTTLFRSAAAATTSSAGWPGFLAVANRATIGSNPAVVAWSQCTGQFSDHVLACWRLPRRARPSRSEEHTSELQSHSDLVCRLLLEKKKKQ